MKELIADLDFRMALGYELTGREITGVRKMIDAIGRQDTEGMYENKLTDYKTFLDRIERKWVGCCYEDELDSFTGKFYA